MDGKIKILYAEDSADWALSVKQILEPENFEVEIARDGEEACEKFRNYTPDLVLLDIDMPGKNGWELIREFKQQNEWIPVVLYSSFYDAKRIGEAFGLGAEDFLSKTCPPEELVERLRAFYTRMVAKKREGKVFRISRQMFFYPLSGMLKWGEHKEILKQNETKLLSLLCSQMNREISVKELCEGIWGKGMYNDTKHSALKIYLTNLRKYLSEDPSVKIINKRWSGYCLICNSGE